MLTNAYYYKLYRPYMVGSVGKNNALSKRSRIAEVKPQDRLDSGMMIVLNKSLNREIVSYARNVSRGVTGFKFSVHTALNNMGSFGLNAMYDGYENARTTLEENLSLLASYYNESSAFLERQNQSPDLRSYSRGLRERIVQGRERLSLIGLSLSEHDEDLRLQFNPSVIRSLSRIEMYSAIGANMQIFHSLNQSTASVLLEPLTTHMPFKGLSYHYNYQLGRMVEDGFNIIESGMIVDRVV